MLKTLFTPDPSNKFSSIHFASKSSYDLYSIAVDSTKTLDRGPKQKAVLELFNRLSSDDIYHQQLFMQQENAIELFDEEQFIESFKKNLDNAMLSKESTASHKFDGILFSLKIKQLQIPLLPQDPSNLTTSRVGNKRKYEVLEEQLGMYTTMPEETFNKIKKNLEILSTLTTDELDEAQLQKMKPIIQSILSREHVQDESIKEIIPVIIHLLNAKNNEISDAAYQFIAEVCVPILDESEFETYWSTATTQIDCNYLPSHLRLLTALFSKANPELMRGVRPLIQSELINENEDVSIAAYHALISCINLCDSDEEINKIVSQAMKRQSASDEWEYTFTRIYEPFGTVIPKLSSAQVSKIFQPFMIDYDEDEWPKNLGVIIPLGACLQRLDPTYNKCIRTILSYLLRLKNEAKEVQEIIELVDKETMCFFDRSDDGLIELCVKHITDQLSSQIISDKILIKFIEYVASNMSLINPVDINKIIPAIVKKVDSNGDVFSDQVNSAASNLILKYILQTTDYNILQKTLNTLKNQKFVQYINTIIEAVSTLNMNVQPEVISSSPTSPQLK